MSDYSFTGDDYGLSITRIMLTDAAIRRRAIITTLLVHMLIVFFPLVSKQTLNKQRRVIEPVPIDILFLESPKTLKTVSIKSSLGSNVLSSDSLSQKKNKEQAVSTPLLQPEQTSYASEVVKTQITTANMTELLDAIYRLFTPTSVNKEAENLLESSKTKRSSLPKTKVKSKQRHVEIPVRSDKDSIDSSSIKDVNRLFRFDIKVPKGELDDVNRLFYNPEDSEIRSPDGSA